MISNAAKRVILRWAHLILTIPVAGFIYGKPADVEQYAGAAQFIFFPAMILTGIWMWKGFIFGILGAGLWLAAFHFSGFGAALLSQIALFIGMKIWTISRTRKTTISAQ